ncbi:Putative ABC transporter [Acididesulfobacillus acetoxydans]|uniref:ABC transporter n=1 Tax=Acididesulfobacillus acetoxydans TaxID=1561005 RepID=A0A8S0XW73_9FIRM|nr:sugar ABC transporter ATP-binding protein [Acididesulfobacillus acetoxydans]CAA7600847.1 Putative ABC transporter [Acididesulfobacillus acetoxydans]CEJ06509.1 Ribose import ATP-binding protein RbsA [Acididesulfobacillus acetoxydans]
MNKDILSMKSVTKCFPGMKALDNVDFSVCYGEVHCLIGANGAGKSTLMKILTGVYSRDSGEIVFKGNKVNFSSPREARQNGISIIHQELSLVDNLSVAENIFLGQNNNFKTVNWRHLYNESRSVLQSIGMSTIYPKELVSNLSIGHRQIVELAKAVALDAKLIVMDEPSATLSGAEYATLVRVIRDLQRKGVSIIYITHRLNELFDIGDKVTVLRDGKVVATQRLTDTNHDELVFQMIGKKVSNQKVIRNSQVDAQRAVLEAQSISTKVIKQLNIKLHAGEILGLYGLVGSGRTELLRVLYGIDQPSSGRVLLNGQPVKLKSPRAAIKKGMALVPENRKLQGVILGLNIWMNATVVPSRDFVKYGFLRISDIRKQVGGMMKRLNIKASSSNTLVGNLSGGNQQKVVLSKWLLKKTSIFLLDEPTQGVDIGAKEEIYRLIYSLASSGNSVIVASSDHEELIHLCDRILVFYDGEIVKEFIDLDEASAKILESAVVGR